MHIEPFLMLTWFVTLHTVSDDDTTQLEQLLDELESELMNSLARKTSGQNIIEAYRTAVAEMHVFFDNIIKRSDILNQGAGLTSAQKMAAIVELKNEFDDQGPVKLADLNQRAGDVKEIISNLDCQQVEEQMKSIERRYNDVSKRLDRKAQVFEVINRSVDSTGTEIDQIQNWLQSHIDDIKTPSSMGAASKSTESRLAELKALSKEADAKKALTDAIGKRVNNMQHELEPLEYSQLETRIRNQNESHKELATLIKSEIASVSQASQTRKKFELDVDKAKVWLKAKLMEVRKQSGSYQPLLSSSVEEDIRLGKSTEADVKIFADGLLLDVTNQGNNILKVCPDDEKERLQKLLADIDTDYNTLRDEIAKKSKLLADLLKDRQQFEVATAQVVNWLNEAELATSGDIRTTNLHILEEQLTKYQKLAEESKNAEKDLSALTDHGRLILPTLSNAEKLKLNDQLKLLRDRFNKINLSISNKTHQINDNIRKYKDGKAKLAECIEFLNRIKQEIRDLNKPVGSTVEDVQNLLTAYEKILDELKGSKNSLSDLQGLDNLPELQSILSQQDGMIKLIEDQLAHLRQLLLLREQFIVLINQIIAFIVKYTSVITDIEKAPDTSIEDKINKYGEVIVKIQECEALLATANDKGQQIALEGSAADQNAITEQLQSLKQQLLNLRKLVETQRQKHELTLAEHRKLAADLSELLDWLHANETTAKSRSLLDRDPDSVEREIQRHDQFAVEVHQYLDKIKKISDQAQHETGIPGSLAEMISEGRSLMNSLPNELSQRLKYLVDSRSNRIDYMKLVSKFNDWVHEAEIRLQNGRHGVDFANIISDLEEHNIFFGNETSINDLVHKQIQNAADRIWPSLQSYDQDELTRELQTIANTKKSTQEAAKTHRAQLEKDAVTWKEYQKLAERVKGILARATFEVVGPVEDLAALQFALQKIAHALNDLQVSLFCDHFDSNCLYS